jgi:hypothetical protein
MKIAKSTIAIALLSAAAGFVAPAHATANQVVYQGPNDGQIKRGLGNLFVKNATPFCIVFSGAGRKFSVLPRTQRTLYIKRDAAYEYRVTKGCGGSVLNKGWADGGAFNWNFYEAPWLPR